MSTDIAIFGAGGLGREVACLIKLLNDTSAGGETYNLIGFFDDAIEIGTQISHYGKVLGGVEEVNNWATPLSLAIAVGNPSSVAAITSHINNHLISYPNLIHPDLAITDPEEFSIGKGNIVKSRCEMAPNVTIGDFNCFIRDVCIGHDTEVGNCNVFMPNVYVCGEVKVGNKNLFGIGSIVLQQLRVGNDVHVGAGAVIFSNPEDGCTYLGNPARKFLTRK